MPDVVIGARTIEYRVRRSERAGRKRIEVTPAGVDTDTRVMSLQEALDRCGWSKPVASQYRREFVEKHRTEGSMRRIQGKWLA